MANVKKSALVPYSAAQMYALVNDLESYPQFLPWCRSSRLLSQKPDEVCAEMVVARAGIQQTFSTCNRLTKDRRIELRLNKGPFKRLQGNWDFIPLREDASKVELQMEFEFAGRLISTAFGPVFHHVAQTLVEAFCKRADALYGSDNHN